MSQIYIEKSREAFQQFRYERISNSAAMYNSDTTFERLQRTEARTRRGLVHHLHTDTIHKYGNTRVGEDDGMAKNGR